MNGFKDNLNSDADKKMRADFHEAGHLEMARHFKPDIRYAIKKDGNGNGRIVFNEEDFATLTLEQKYMIGVAGCISEAKGAKGGGDILIESLERVWMQIYSSLASGEEKWQVDVPVGSETHSEPAGCNKFDFNFLKGGSANGSMIRNSVIEVSNLFNSRDVWVRVEKAAASDLLS